MPANTHKIPSSNGASNNKTAGLWPLLLLDARQCFARHSTTQPESKVDWIYLLYKWNMHIWAENSEMYTSHLFVLIEYHKSSAFLNAGTFLFNMLQVKWYSTIIQFNKALNMEHSLDVSSFAISHFLVVGLQVLWCHESLNQTLQKNFIVNVSFLYKYYLMNGNQRLYDTKDGIGWDQ